MPSFELCLTLAYVRSNLAFHTQLSSFFLSAQADRSSGCSVPLATLEASSEYATLNTRLNVIASLAHSIPIRPAVGGLRTAFRSFSLSLSLSLSFPLSISRLVLNRRYFTNIRNVSPFQAWSLCNPFEQGTRRTPRSTETFTLS